MVANLTPIAASGPNPLSDIRFRLFTFSVDPALSFAITDPVSESATEPPPPMRFPENMVRGAKLALLASTYVLIVDPLAFDPFVTTGLYMTDPFGCPAHCLRLLGDFTDASLVPARASDRRLANGRSYALLWSANPGVATAYMDELTARIRALGLQQSATATDRRIKTDFVRAVLVDFVKGPAFWHVQATPRPSLVINRGKSTRYDFVDADGEFGGDHADIPAALTMAELLLEQARVGGATTTSLWSFSDIGHLASRVGEPGRRFAYDPSGVNQYLLAGRATVGALELAELLDREARRRLRNGAWGQASLAAHVEAGHAANQAQPLPNRHTQLSEAFQAHGTSKRDADALALRHAAWIHDIANRHRDKTSASQVQKCSAAVLTLTVPGYPTYWEDDVAEARDLLRAEPSEVFEELFGLYYPGSGRGTGLLPGVRTREAADAAIGVIQSATKSYYEHYLFAMNFRDMVVPETALRMETIIERTRVSTELATADIRQKMKRLLADRCPFHRLVAEAIHTGAFESKSYEDIVARYLNLTRQWTDSIAVKVPESEDPFYKKVMTNVVTPAAGISKILREHYRQATETLLWQVMQDIGGPKDSPKIFRERVAAHVEGVTSCMKWFGWTDTPGQLVFGVAAHAALNQGGVLVQPWFANPANPASKQMLTSVLLGVLEDRSSAGTVQLSQELAEEIVAESSALATIKPLAAPAFCEEFVGLAGSAIAIAEFAQQFSKSDKLSQRALLVLKISKEMASAVSNLASAVRVVLLVKASSTLLRGTQGALSIEGGAVRVLRLARTAEGIATKATKVAQGLDVAISAYEAGDLFLNPESPLARASESGDIETYRLQMTRGALLGTSAAVGLAGLTGVLALSWAGPIGVGIGAAIVLVEWGISSYETQYYSLRTQANEQFQYEYKYDPNSRVWVSGSLKQLKQLVTPLLALSVPSA